jgi:hypothetical protein
MKGLFHYVGILLIAATVFVTSCKEEVAPTVLEIQVVTDSGEVVPYADILLTCTSSVNKPCEIEIMAQADANGFYTREFDLPKVLEVTVGAMLVDSMLVGIPPVWVVEEDSVCGASFVSIKPEETTRATVIAYDCN